MMKRLCGMGAWGQVAGLLLVTGLAVALLFDGLVAIGGGALVIGAGVMFALMLEDTVEPSPQAEPARASASEMPSSVQTPVA